MFHICCRVVRAWIWTLVRFACTMRVLVHLSSRVSSSVRLSSGESVTAKLNVKAKVIFAHSDNFITHKTEGLSFSLIGKCSDREALTSDVYPYPRPVELGM